MEYHIFYNSDKKIIWGTINDTPQSVIDNQAEDGLSHLQIEVDTLPSISENYVNDAGTGIVPYGRFTPNLPRTFMYINESMDITNIPEGSTVYIDGENSGTIDSDGTLSITGSNAGKFNFKLTKDKYLDHTFQVLVYGDQSYGN